MIGITGAKGVIGRLIVEELKSQKLDYSAFSGDIRKKEDVKNWLENAAPSFIIHLAAVVPVDIVEMSPATAYSVNVGGIINLLETIEELSIKPFLMYSSTSHVYKSQNRPITEEDEILPLNHYGYSKWMGEKIVTQLCPKMDMKYCIARIFSFYHEYQQKPFLYPSIMERLKNEDLSKPFVLKGANSIRDLLHASDVAKILLRIMERGLEGVYNIGSGKGILIKDFVQSLSTQKINIINDVQVGDSYLVADISKLTKALGNG